MTKRPWHEKLAATAVFPWWVNLALGVHALARAVAMAVRMVTGDRSAGGGDVAWAVVGLVAGAGWLAVAYAKHRHRHASERP